MDNVESLRSMCKWSKQRTINGLKEYDEGVESVRQPGVKCVIRRP